MALVNRPERLVTLVLVREVAQSHSTFNPFFSQLPYKNLVGTSDATNKIVNFKKKLHMKAKITHAYTVVIFPYLNKDIISKKKLN